MTTTRQRIVEEADDDDGKVFEPNSRAASRCPAGSAILKNARSQPLVSPSPSRQMHLCWGNYPGPHHYDVPLQDIVDVVWKAKPHAIPFEAANPRHAHEWAVV